MPFFIFYLTFGLLAYTYIGYLVIIFLLSIFMENKTRKMSIVPDVTVIIPVFNEEKSIARKLKNCLNYDYPRDHLKILVVSDCSTDGTDEIVKSFKSEQIKLLALEERRGKVAAQNFALEHTESEIIIFTDSAIQTPPNSIKKIVSNFADSSIGAVSCHDKIIKENEKYDGEDRYIKYDMLVRRFISRTHSLIGVTGGFYAIRRKLIQAPWNPAFPPDFYAAILCIKQGYRVVEDPEVEAFYKTAVKRSDEYQRKVRTFNRGIHAFFANILLLNIFKYKLSAFALISQKLFRWLTPLFFAAMFISNIFLVEHHFLYKIAFYSQIFIYGFCALSLLLHKLKVPLFFLEYFYYFAITYSALIKAWLEFFRGKKYAIWQPTIREN